MDEDRKIRFLVSPILFFASLILGIWYSPQWWLPPTPWHQRLIDLVISPNSANDDVIKVFALIIGGGIALFTIGYVIGTLTYALLRALFWAKSKLFGGSGTHEVSLTIDNLARIWKVLGAPDWNQREHELFAGVTFDHGLLRAESEGVHLWLVRRWSAFSISITSMVGLLISILFGRFVMGIPCSFAWLVPVSLFGVVLLVIARWSWSEVMNMLGFMAALPRHSAPKLTLRWKGPRPKDGR